MLNNEMLKKYYEMVDHNQHGEVLEEVAKDFNLSHYAKIFESVNRIHILEQSLSYDLMKVRDRVKEEMFNCLENILTSSEYQAIRSIV